MSRAIGRADRAAHYDSLFEQVRDHFRRIYCNAEGDLEPPRCARRPATCWHCATICSCPNGALLPLRHSKQKIIDNGYKLSTGFVGSCILNEVLAEFGKQPCILSVAPNENPSRLYSVHRGATTIRERWNSYTKATGFGDVGMNSFNHYAYGAVQEWMYRHIAGIETTEQAPGFAHLILQPKPDTRSAEEIPAGQEKITWVRTSFASPSVLSSPHGI